MTTAAVLIGICITTSYFFFFRNEKVAAFRKSIIDQAFNGDHWSEKIEIYRDGPGYSEMVFSFKPLKLESFYTPEEIEVLNK